MKKDWRRIGGGGCVHRCSIDFRSMVDLLYSAAATLPLGAWLGGVGGLGGLKLRSASTRLEAKGLGGFVASSGFSFEFIRVPDDLVVIMVGQTWGHWRFGGFETTERIYTLRGQRPRHTREAI